MGLEQLTLLPILPVCQDSREASLGPVKEYFYTKLQATLTRKKKQTKKLVLKSGLTVTKHISEKKKLRKNICNINLGSTIHNME